MSEAMERPKSYWQDWIPGDGRVAGRWENCMNGGPGKCHGRESWRLLGSNGEVLKTVGPQADVAGPSQPQVAVGQRPMEATRDGNENPAGCLSCGGEWNVPDWEWIYCRECHDKYGEPALQKLAVDWRDGKRDFPRRPEAQAVPAQPAPAPQPRYNIAAGAGAELHDHGHPRTALEAIQARKKPEPWRPSVDDFDLLPDVDVRR